MSAWNWTNKPEYRSEPPEMPSDWWLFAVPLALLLLFPAIMAISERQTDPRKQQCEARGGVLVRTYPGRICLRRDAVIELDKGDTP